MSLANEGDDFADRDGSRRIPIGLSVKLRIAVAGSGLHRRPSPRKDKRSVRDARRGRRSAVCRWASISRAPDPRPRGRAHPHRSRTTSTSGRSRVNGVRTVTRLLEDQMRRQGGRRHPGTSRRWSSRRRTARIRRRLAHQTDRSAAPARPLVNRNRAREGREPLGAIESLLNAAPRSPAARRAHARPGSEATRPCRRDRRRRRSSGG